MDPFQRLEEKLTKIVEMYKRTQATNAQLTAEIEKLRSDSRTTAERHTALEREVELMRREREDVRARVERLLDQVDALTKQESAG